MIDWTRVATLRDEVGTEHFDEVVEIFIEEVDAKIERLKADPDLSRLEEDLHFIKGSALNLGFRTFSILCREGETLSAKGAAANVDLANIVQSYEVSKQSFLADLKSAIAR